MLLSFTIAACLWSLSRAEQNVSNQIQSPNFESHYSSYELSALDKVRGMVWELLYKDYMKTNEYLIPFIRAKDFRLDDAREMIRRAHAFRLEKGVDGLLDENMSQLEKHFPYTSDGLDFEGRPVICWNFGRWDIRRIALARKMDLLHKYTNRMLEEGVTKVRQHRETTGKFVTQVVVIVDGNGYNLHQHACISCLPFYYNFVRLAELYYPQSAKSMHMINVPRIFDALLSLLRPLMSEYTRNALHVWGHDKSEWRRVFSQTIGLDQIRPSFGGTRKP